jgi:hypothetical protein
MKTPDSSVPSSSNSALTIVHDHTVRYPHVSYSVYIIHVWLFSVTYKVPSPPPPPLPARMRALSPAPCPVQEQRQDMAQSHAQTIPSPTPMSEPSPISPPLVSAPTSAATVRGSPELDAARPLEHVSSGPFSVPEVPPMAPLDSVGSAASCTTPEAPSAVGDVVLELPPIVHNYDHVEVDADTPAIADDDDEQGGDENTGMEEVEDANGGDSLFGDYVAAEEHEPEEEKSPEDEVEMSMTGVLATEEEQKQLMSGDYDGLFTEPESEGMVDEHIDERDREQSPVAEDASESDSSSESDGNEDEDENGDEEIQVMGQSESEREDNATQATQANDTNSSPRRKRGRPKGSLNKATLQRHALTDIRSPSQAPAKRPRGRPKSEKTLVREREEEMNRALGIEKPKKKRGRPKKVQVIDPLTLPEEEKPKRKRGRPRKVWSEEVVDLTLDSDEEGEEEGNSMDAEADLGADAGVAEDEGVGSDDFEAEAPAGEAWGDDDGLEEEELVRQLADPGSEAVYNTYEIYVPAVTTAQPDSDSVPAGITNALEPQNNVRGSRESIQDLPSVTEASFELSAIHTSSTIVIHLPPQAPSGAATALAQEEAALLPPATKEEPPEVQQQPEHTRSPSASTSRISYNPVSSSAAPPPPTTDSSPSSDGLSTLRLMLTSFAHSFARCHHQ